MKNKRYIFALLAIMVIAPFGAMARTVEIKMSTCPKPLVDNIKKMTSALNYNDQLIMNFDKAGKYIIDGSILIKSNVVIKGVGSKSTRLIVQEGFANGKSKMTINSFFRIKGDENHKLKVKIRDIGFELVSHKGILWEKAEKQLVCLWNADGVMVDNVVFKSQDAEITNLDLRDCSNVLIQNCEFENYNNCETGGCLWSRGEQHNIRIVNNVFSKYGKDEVLGCWGGVHDKEFEIKNVVVENNEFVLEKKTGTKTMDLHNFITFSHHYGEGAKTHCNIDSIFFRNNNIRIDAPINRVMVLNFCKYATVNNLEVSNNEILCTSRSSAKSFMNDFEVISDLFENMNITIKGNYIKNKNEVTGDDGHTFLSTTNGVLKVENNTIDNDNPQRLVWCHAGSLKLELTHNTVSNMRTSSLSASKGVDNVSITAMNNRFAGDTRIYCRNVKNLDLVYKNNEFNSTNVHFFLQEGAQNTAIIFEDNVVNAMPGNGLFYANYGGSHCNFGNVTVCNNTFNGVKNGSMRNSLVKAKKLNLNNNIYR